MSMSLSLIIRTAWASAYVSAHGVRTGRMCGRYLCGKGYRSTCTRWPYYARKPNNPTISPYKGEGKVKNLPEIYMKALGEDKRVVVSVLEPPLGLKSPQFRRPGSTAPSAQSCSLWRDRPLLSACAVLNHDLVECDADHAGQRARA